MGEAVVFDPGFRNINGSDLNTNFKAVGAFSTSSITADTGNAQASAVLLGPGANQVGTSTNSGTDGVLLPPALIGQPPVVVVNNTANTIKVWPAGTDTITPNTSITAGSAGAAQTLATVKSATFVVMANGAWKEILSA